MVLASISTHWVCVQPRRDVDWPGPWVQMLPYCSKAVQQRGLLPSHFQHVTLYGHSLDNSNMLCGALEKQATII